MTAESATAYPLTWPASRPRMPASDRQFGRFSTKSREYSGSNSWQRTKNISIAQAVLRLQEELDRLGAFNPILSTNVKLRLDGVPRSDQAEPADPGVAVYFKLQGIPHCLPCDRYKQVAQNIAALAAHMEATRAIERYGVSSVREMFTGFAALPDPNKPKSWRDILGFGTDAGPTADEIERRYRQLAQIHHPDKGGDPDQFAQITKARDQGRIELL